MTSDDLFSLSIDGELQNVTAGSDGFALFQTRSIVAMRVNGELRDLAHKPSAGDVVEGVDISSPDGLNILRHSAAHVLAQAVQRINPEAKLGIGPPVVDGFYYDFDVETPFTPEDLKALEKEMDRIIRSGQRFMRRVTTESAARAELAKEPYKLELIGLKGADLGEGSAEVGGAELTIYDNVDPSTSEVVWFDLCRGPHLPNTRMIGNGYALSRVASAYWRGNEKNKQLQRIYGTAWPSKDELRAHQERLEEAAKRDHRRLGAELDLFSFPRRSAQVWQYSIQRAASFVAKWKITAVSVTRKLDTNSFTARTSLRERSSRYRGTCSGTPTACSHPSGWTRNLTSPVR